MITCIGKIDDLPAVTGAMDLFLERTKGNQGVPRELSGSFNPLLMASQGLLYLGARPAAEPATAGEIAIYLGALLVFPEERPDDWRQRCEGWRRHPVPFVRRVAEQALDQDAGSSGARPAR